MFFSAKFSRKVTYINRLDQLAEYVHLDNIQIPEEVKRFEFIFNQSKIDVPLFFVFVSG